MTAADASSDSVFDDFAIAVANVNDAPTVAAPLSDQPATQGVAFSYTFAAGDFADIVPDRVVSLVADSAYINTTVLKDLPDNVVVLGPLSN